MKLTTQVITSRFHRRTGKGNCYKKLLSSHQKSCNGSKREIVRETSPCDNSDDSGLGIENSPDYLYNPAIPHPSVFRFASSQKRPSEEPYVLNSKRHRVDLKVENYLSDPYTFPVPPAALSNSNCISANPSGLRTSIPVASKVMRRSLVAGKRLPVPVTLSSQLSSTSRNGKVQLQILNQPEQQHRARYQTEGSRGAVKDRTGNSFPVVKVVGYDRLTTLQVFIGSDQGRVTPHMFYQACRVTGKNSTPCTEKNIDGTIVIEIDIEPAKDMTVTCDCVGILKERNVDVEHRFPEECSTRSKKKSTRCRMVFRTLITNDDLTTETLQVASQPIACTQPPGIPEICKKSLTSCPVAGGKELFILGKNFLKDTQVLFQTDDWEQSVNPDKEFLQQTHLVCVVPSYKTLETAEPVAAKISVVSGSRASEPHSFTYTPMTSLSQSLPPVSSANSLVTDATTPCSEATEVSANSETGSGLSSTSENVMKTANSARDDCENVHPVLLWPSSNLSSPTDGSCNLQNDSKMMPPPAMLPRRSSVQMIVPENMSSNAKPDSSNTSSDVIPVTTSSQLASGVPSHTFVSAPFTAMPEVPTMMSDFARNFHPLADVEASLKTEPTVPKVEPLSDSPALSCTAESYSVPQSSDTQSSQTCLVPSIKTTSSLCISQAPADLYAGSQNFMYRPATIYSDVVAKTEQPENRSPVEELTTFDVTDRPPSIITTNSNGDLMMSATRTNLKPAESINFISSNPLPINPSGILPQIRSTSVDNKISRIINLSDASFGKARSFEFNEIMSQQQQQQQQQLATCFMKPSSSYENIRSAVCYKNVPATTESAAAVYPNFMNLETESPLNDSDSNMMFKKSPENKPVAASLSMATEPPMILENTSMSLMPKVMGPRENSLDNYSSVLPVSKNQLTSESSFLSAQPQDSTLTEFVPSTLVDNAVNTVPKLEELVNSTAESYIRSGQSASSLNLVTNANCVANTMSLDTFLSNAPQSNLMNNVICNTVTATTDSCASGSSISDAYQCGNMVANMEMSNVVPPKPMNVLELKDVKDENKPTPEMKKTVEGMFSSEISRMTENDLLSYINPSCFDEV